MPDCPYIVVSPPVVNAELSCWDTCTCARCQAGSPAPALSPAPARGGSGAPLQGLPAAGPQPPAGGRRHRVSGMGTNTVASQGGHCGAAGSNVTQLHTAVCRAGCTGTPGEGEARTQQTAAWSDSSAAAVPNRHAWRQQLPVPSRGCCMSASLPASTAAATPPC